MGKYFGTDGFRGEANVGLTVMHAFEIGRYLGWYYGKEHKAKVVIGKDTRRSSYMLESALCAGLTASGAAFAAGICLAPRFAGTGYDPDGRMQGDFGSNVYFIQEVCSHEKP